MIRYGTDVTDNRSKRAPVTADRKVISELEGSSIHLDTMDPLMPAHGPSDEGQHGTPANRGAVSRLGLQRITWPWAPVTNQSIDLELIGRSNPANPDR